jgi:hypothetical protein
MTDRKAEPVIGLLVEGILNKKIILEYDMRLLFSLRGILLFFVCVLAAGNAPAANTTARYLNDQFGFSFHYPASWIFTPGAQRAMRVQLVTPDGVPAAACAVMVKEYPNAVNARQEEIDEIFEQTPTKEELQEVLGQEEEHLHVIKASTGRLDGRPTHVGTYRLRQGLDEYLYGRVIMTATPGLTWSVSCRGLGESREQAKKNFVSWQQDIDALIDSFTLPTD